MPAKTAKKTFRRSAPAKRSQTPREPAKLSREETTKLLLQSQDAFNHQSKLGRVEPGEKFDDWRRDQVMDCVGLAGISKISSGHWRTVMAHFLTLEGKEDEAFELLNKTGQKGFRPKGPDDTYESCETYVHQIREALAKHATATVVHEKGRIHTGWFVACARQRTRKPTLTMDTLAERLDPKTLKGLLSHLVNHIATREGRATDRRSKRQYPKKADPGEMAEPF
ncbi:MAG: hypothetical protein QM680_14205 [Luteolibacter sp.]